MKNSLKLYHGSNCDFSAVDLSKSKNKRDFGRGFYLTTYENQAKEWAEALFARYGGDGIFVYEFEFIEHGNLNIKRFNGVSEEWLKFVKDNRAKGSIQHKFDIVVGAVANDKTNRTIALYVDGIYTAKEAIKKLKSNKLNDQMSFHNQTAIKCLTLLNKKQYGN